MTTTLIIAALIGLLLGILVNFLSDFLPQQRADITIEEGDAVAKKTSYARKEAKGDSVPSVYGLLRKALSSDGYSRPAFSSAARYPLTEVGLIIISVYLVVGNQLTFSYAVLVFYMALFALITVIDIEHRLVLNIVMFPAFVIGLLEVTLNNRIKFADGMMGYAIAQIIVMAFYLLGFVYLWVINTNRENPVNEVAFGFGDVTLATFCGLIVGNPGVYFMLFWMVFFGALSAIGTIVIFQLLRGGRFRAHMAIPYGPSIVLAAAVLLLSENPVSWSLFFLLR